MTKDSLALLIFFCSVAPIVHADPPEDRLPRTPAGKAWKMVWHDEFEGTKLDESKWVYRPDGKRKDGWWSRRAVALDGNGHLAIKACNAEGKYIDGCIVTQGKFEHTFGYYVARIRLQKQPGHWPAFWLTSSGVSKLGSGGREGTEIDVMEKPWLDGRINYALHWDGYGTEHKSKSTKVNVPDVMEGWHTFGLWWSPDAYAFYVDGREMWATNPGGISKVPEYILLSDEVGKWAGDIKKAKLPDEFLVDYVRVYDLVEGNHTGSEK
jgi:beta-glucanase (GH16 family)